MGVVVGLGWSDVPARAGGSGMVCDAWYVLLMQPLPNGCCRQCSGREGHACRNSHHGCVVGWIRRQKQSVKVLVMFVRQFIPRPTQTLEDVGCHRSLVPQPRYYDV